MFDPKVCFNCGATKRFFTGGWKSETRAGAVFDYCPKCWQALHAGTKEGGTPAPIPAPPPSPPPPIVVAESGWPRVEVPTAPPKQESPPGKPEDRLVALRQKLAEIPEPADPMQQLALSMTRNVGLMLQQLGARLSSAGASTPQATEEVVSVRKLVLEKIHDMGEQHPASVILREMFELATGEALSGQHLAPQAPPAAAPERTWSERDNLGTRQETLEQADAYWAARITARGHDPFILYEFDAEGAARAAMLELPCVHTASESGKLICTEMLVFGFYRTEKGKYEGVLAGNALRHELWAQAKASFEKHGGKRKNDREPPVERAKTTPQAVPSANGVMFVREEKRPSPFGGQCTYRIYRAPNGEAATAFLKENPVRESYVYLVVETPEGNYCRDIDGFYKE